MLPEALGLFLSSLPALYGTVDGVFVSLASFGSTGIEQHATNNLDRKVSGHSRINFHSELNMAKPMSPEGLGRHHGTMKILRLLYIVVLVMVLSLDLKFIPVDAYHFRPLSHQSSGVPGSGSSKSTSRRTEVNTTANTAPEDDLSDLQLIKVSGNTDHWILVEGDEKQVTPDLSQQLSPLTSSDKPNDNTPKYIKNDELVEDEQEEKEDEEKEMSKFAILTAVECIVILLVMMTIGFEEMKEYVEENSSRDLHPIIDSLFGEMTILGFLSAFTFVLTKIGLFEHLSAWLFGENERDFLIEAFETIHFTLFFIMVCFVLQVLCLMKDASHAEEEWLKLDAACQNDEFRRLHEQKLRNKRRKRNQQCRRNIPGKHITKRLSTMSTVSSSMSIQPTFFRLVSSIRERPSCAAVEDRRSLTSPTRTVSYGALTQLRNDTQPNSTIKPDRESSSLGNTPAFRNSTSYEDEILLSHSSSSEETNNNGEEEETKISDELKMFDALREEFILDRSLYPPFAPKPADQRLPSDFNFGRYLAMCLGKTIAKVVHVNIETWYSVILFSLGFYCIGLFVNLVALAVIWTIFGYLSLAFSLYFEVYLMQLRNAFIPRNILEPSVEDTKKNQRSTTSSSWTKRTERTSYSINNGDNDNESISSKDDETQQKLSNLQTEACISTMEDFELPAFLPRWCTLNESDHAKRRGTTFMSMMALFFGAEDLTKANRQEKCFWGGKKGKKVHTIALQLNLVFTGVYCAFQIIVFLPVIWNIHLSRGILHWTIFVLYLILSIVPVVGLVCNKAALVSTLSLVGSIGCHRAHQTMAGVLREEKTARAVRSIVVIHSLYNAVNNDDSSRNNTTCPQVRPLCHYALLQISNIFDTFDKDNDGVLSHDELRNVLTSLPGDLSQEQVHRVIQTLDVDGSGDISREEFIRWCVERMRQEHSSSSGDEQEHDPKNNQLAHDLFQMFDKDGSGEITISEFKSILDHFHLNFTLEEIGDIVRQLDENGDGMIGVEEFEFMLERFKIKLFEDNGHDDHFGDENQDERLLEAAERDDIMIISSMHSHDSGSSLSLQQSSADAGMDCAI